MLLYIAGPYRDSKKDGIRKNIMAAREVAAAVWGAGHVAICPHLNTFHFEEFGFPDGIYLEGDLKILARCDGILMMSNWSKSAGAIRERGYAEENGIPIFYEIPPLHPVEKTSPVQIEAFIHTIMQMYRTHLDKNRDYSPANILGTGEVGVVTRIWDKTARLLNLLGCRLSCGLGAWTAGMPPQNEAVDDTYLDLANYAVIGWLVRNGKWGL